METILLDERAVCRALSLSPKTLFNLRRDGKIRFAKIGKAVRYRAEDVKAFAESITQGGHDGQRDDQ